MGKVKGSLLVKPLKFLRTRKDAARAALPESMHHYLGRHILHSHWYEEDDYFAIMRACSVVMPEPDIDPWEFMGRFSARVDFEGIYAAHVWPGNPERTLKSFARLWKLRHDTGTVTVSPTGPGEARVELRDYVLVSGEVCRSIQGHIWETLHQTDVGAIEVRKALCRAEGDELCRWTATWDVPSDGVDSPARKPS
jgi:hypothetical protein